MNPGGVYMDAYYTSFSIFVFKFVHDESLKIRLPFSSPVHENEKWKWSSSVVSDS